MPTELLKSITQESKNLTRDIEVLEFQLADKRRALELLNGLIVSLKESAEASPARRSKQPISEMIMKILQNRKKPAHPKNILVALGRLGYTGSPAVMYATLGRLVKSEKLFRSNGGYVLTSEVV